MAIYTRIALVFLVMAPAVMQAASVDQEIEEAGRASYNFRTVLRGRVSIDSHKGVVTLSGVVENWDERALAALTVESFAGVGRVNNEVIAQWSVVEYCDAWIALRMRGQLLMKAHVNPATTTVTVAEGVVTLTGTSASDAQRDLTTGYAREISHVKSVRNEMVVNSVAPSTESATEAVDDASITGLINLALRPSPSRRSLELNVATKNGAVTISGEAADDAAKARITKLAESIRGVKSVSNEMVVKA